LPKIEPPGMLSGIMKNWIGVILLGLLCLGLGVALLLTKKQATEQQSKDADMISALSNRVFKTSSDLDEERQLTATLYKDIDVQKKAVAELTNNFTMLSSNLSQVSVNLAQTEASLKSSEEEVKKRDGKIAELENQNQLLDKRALDLSTAITNLTGQISDTKKRLAASEGNRVELESQLKRLMSEKSELERQFNDLAILRAQVAKLKEELTISRRIEWIRRGLYAGSDQKGAQQLLQGANAFQPKPAKANYDLNVEVTADGKVRVIPPATNRPAAAIPPPT
jgi:septal ring factor EnvC (AmiA/AmiB activator)